MKDSSLLKAAFVTAIIGVAALFVLYRFAEVEETDLSLVENMDQYEDVRVVAIVKEIRKAGNVTILTLEKSETMEAVAFEPLNVSEGEEVEVTGEVSEYEGEKQITIERVGIRG